MENVLWKWGVGACLDREGMEFVIAGWSKMKFYDFIIWSWSKQWKILLAVISKPCLWWFDSDWQRLKLRQLVSNNWVHVLLDLFLGGWGEGGGGIGNAYTFFGGIVVGRFKCKKIGWPSKEEIISNSTETLIQFKEEHLGLLKTVSTFGARGEDGERGVPVWREMGLSPKDGILIEVGK